MATLYYKNPQPPNNWIPFGTTNEVADEVQILSTAPTEPLTELWIDPAGTGTDSDWSQFDSRYVNITGDTLTGPLILPSAAPTNNLQAVTKQYVDTTLMALAKQEAANHTPIGSVIQFAGKHIPRGWHLCDGTAHGSWALQNALESPNTPTIPSTPHFRYIIFGGV